MPKRLRIEYEALATHPTAVVDDAAIGHLRHLRLSASTLRQYKSHINGFRRFMEAKKATCFTKQMFLDLAVQLQAAGKGGVDTLAQQLSALRHFQRVDGLWCTDDSGMWSLDTDLDEVVQGVAFDGKNSRRSSPGAITTPMLAQLISLDMPPSLKRAYQIAFGARLRVSQLTNLKINSLQWGDRGEPRLIAEKDKRVRASSRRGEVHVKPMDVEAVEHFQAQVAVAVAADERSPSGDVWLFPPSQWKYSQALHWLKTAAAHFKWPQSLEWGFHSTRHGGAAAHAALREDLVMSAPMVRKYTQDNHARTTGRRPGVEKTKAKPRGPRKQ